MSSQQKLERKTKYLSLLSLLLILVATSFATAQQNEEQTQNSQQQEPQQKSRPQRRADLMLGICIGQVLATAETPVILPVPQKGETPTALDETTKAAVKAAFDLCRDQMFGTSSSTTSN